MPALKAVVTTLPFADKLDALALFAQRGVLAVGILRAIATARNELRRLWNAFAVHAPQTVPAENALVVAIFIPVDILLAIPILAKVAILGAWVGITALSAIKILVTTSRHSDREGGYQDRGGKKLDHP
jgi:hypothetical protein